MVVNSGHENSTQLFAFGKTGEGGPKTFNKGVAVTIVMAAHGELYLELAQKFTITAIKFKAASVKCHKRIIFIPRFSPRTGPSIRLISAISLW